MFQFYSFNLFEIVERGDGIRKKQPKIKRMHALKMKHVIAIKTDAFLFHFCFFFYVINKSFRKSSIYTNNMFGFRKTDTCGEQRGIKYSHRNGHIYSLAA